MLPEFVIDKLIEKGLSVDLSQWGVRLNESDVVMTFSNSLTNKKYKLYGFRMGGDFILKDMKVGDL